MRVLILDGHPDAPQRLTHALLDAYAAALPAGTEIERIAARDLVFQPNLAQGYAKDVAWEPDLARFADALAACDHLVIGFPMWWGGEPALVKGLFDRILLPGYAFRYHRENVFWDRLLAGRSADVLVTMDTPPWYLKWAFGNPVVHRMKKQVLGFCGVKPVRVLRFGPTRRGGAAKNFEGWKRQAARAAASAPGLNRGARHAAGPRSDFAAAMADRG